MNDVMQKAPLHLWIVGVLSLLWNLGGVASYVSTKFGMLDGADFDPDMLAYFYGFPAWASAFWALGVWGAFLGSVGLLLRKGWAATALGIALFGLLGTTFYERAVADIPAGLQTPGQLVFAVAIWVITLGLFFYARAMRRRGILR